MTFKLSVRDGGDDDGNDDWDGDGNDDGDGDGGDGDCEDWDGDGDNDCIWIVTLYIVQLYTILVSFNWFIYY